MRERKKQVDTDGKISRPHAGHPGGIGEEELSFAPGVAGRADDEWLFRATTSATISRWPGELKSMITSHASMPARNVVAGVDDAGDHAGRLGGVGNRVAHAATRAATRGLGRVWRSSAEGR